MVFLTTGAHQPSLIDLVVMQADKASLHAMFVTLVLMMLGACAVIYTIRFLVSLKAFLRTAHVLSPIPSAPGSIFFFGHALNILQCYKNFKGPWDWIEDWLLAAGGSIVRWQLLTTHVVVISDPLALKRILQVRQKVYEKDLVTAYSSFLPILGTGLVTSDGELWQQQRLLIGPALRLDLLDYIIGIAKRATDRLFVKLQAARGTGKPVEMLEEFRLLTLQVIGEAVLSLPPEECDRVFPELYLPVMEEANKRAIMPHRKYLPTPTWFIFKERIRKLNAYIISIIRKRWNVHEAGAAPAKGDILDRVIAASMGLGAKLNHALEQQLCYEIKTFLLAGHETSAAMLTWSLYELTQNSEFCSKVLTEAEAVFHGDEEPPRAAVDGMAYTLAVLKESLRKYSIVPVVTRHVAQDDELMGYAIPKGTMVCIHIQSVHNKWKDPKTFSPDRFMPDGEYDQFDESIQTYMFLPFVAGPRNCLGQHMALLEARVVLAMLVKNFKFTTWQPGPAQRDPHTIPVAPHGGMHMLIE